MWRRDISCMCQPLRSCRLSAPRRAAVMIWQLKIIQGHGGGEWLRQGSALRSGRGMSQPAHGPVRHRHVQPLSTHPFPRGCFSREEASLPSLTIPPHTWVSGPSFPVAFAPRWDKCKVFTGARSRWWGGNTLGRVPQISRPASVTKV